MTGSWKSMGRIPLAWMLAGMAALPPAGHAERMAPLRGPSGYQLQSKVPLGGEEGWDYLTLDSLQRRLYVSRDTRVLVVDVDTDKVVGEIRNTNGVHGIAIAPDCSRGYTTNGKDGTSTVFDVKTLKTLGQVKVGKNPDAITYDPLSKRVFVFNGSGESATVIDAATGSVAGTIGLGGVPEFAVADGEGRVYVNVADKNLVAVIDTRKLAVAARFALGGGKKPTGLAIDRKNRRLFSACRDSSTLVVLDADSGKVLASLPIGGGVDAAEFDPATSLAFSSNGDGSITIVREESPAQFTVLENLKTQAGAKTMALDSRSHRIYLAASEQGHAMKEVSLLVFAKK